MSHVSMRRASALFVAALFALAGCSGSDGATGAAGPAGPEGPTGPTGPQGEPPQATLEQCAGCHAGSIAAKHALAPLDAVGVKLQHWSATGAPVLVGGVQLPAVSVDATTFAVTVRFNVRVNGVPRLDFLQRAADMRAHNEDAWWYYDAAQRAGVRTKIGPTNTPATNWTVVGNGNGNYTATITGFTAPPVDGTTYMLSTMGPDEMTATAVAYYNGRANDVVSDAACINCHGNHVWRGAAHDVTNPQGVGPCIVCHNRVGSADPRLPGAGSGLMGIVHGIHNSKNMPDGQYTFTWTNGNQFNFSNGFPGNVNNCATCHATTAELAAVAAAPFSYGLCISCHDSFTSFANAPASHDTFATTQACDGCHAGETVSTAHNGSVTERAGLIWDGADQSVVLAPTTVTEITGLTVSGSNLVVTWTATDTVSSTALNPCNSDYATGPVFFGAVGTGSSEGCTNSALGCASNMSFVRAYAQANDWVNDQLTGSTAPGQPPSNTVTSTNTTCAGNVATTTLALSGWEAGATIPTKGVIALQGKAQIRFAPSNTIIWIRTKSATREFNVADASVPAAADQRRQLVDVNKCNACHLGTLYQHGGNRVDSIELCVMCHNPSSSEQNRRAGMGVTAAVAYDGLNGQTYDLRTMVHAIHAAGENGKQLMYYRSNGIYLFASKATRDTIATWPPTANPSACVSCFDPEDGDLVWCPVYGSANGGNVMTSVAGVCTEGGPSTNGTWRPHRFIEVEYPRALNDCSACHVAGAVDGLPDPTQAVAVTYETGASTDWKVLVDDVLIGPSAASCMSCHQSGDPAIQFGLRTHAYGFGWAPAVFPNGRQTLIDAATP